MPGRTKTRTKKKPAKKQAAAAARGRAKKVAKAKASARAPAKRKAARKAPSSAKRAAARKPRPSEKRSKAARKAAAPEKRAKKTVQRSTEARAAAKAKAPKKAARSVDASRLSEPPRPSQRALVVSSALPAERSLTDEEREAMFKVAATARRFLDVAGSPETVIMRIGTFVDEVRRGERQEPKTQDVRLGLGVLWGEQIRAQVGWTWVHLTYPDGFASYALVPDDRAFACFPLNRVPDLMRASSRTNTSVRVFESIRDGSLPARRENAYLVIG